MHPKNRQQLGFVAALGIILLAIVIWIGMASAKDDRDRDRDIKANTLDTWRSEDRLQKQIDELRGRIEKIEAQK